tara:strand:+ start:170 stop:544 length:375 start_codon:yes stop_codon:yes gene_type:complete
MKKPSDKSFGLLFAFVFLVVALWPILKNNSINLIALFSSISLLIISFIKPELLKPFNYLWMKLGLVLGKIVPPIIMFMIFFTVITPIGILLRIFKKDLLCLKFINEDTYWQDRKENVTTMDKQF